MIQTYISNGDCRNNGIGDYYVREGMVYVIVKPQDNPDHEFLIAIHELVEEYLTRKKGIKEAIIDTFDAQYEIETAQGLHDDLSEPGDDLRAPYWMEHQFATYLEKLVAEELGVDWEEYCKA